MTWMLKIYFLLFQEEMSLKYKRVTRALHLKNWEIIYLAGKILNVIFFYYVINTLAEIVGHWNTDVESLGFLIVYLVINLSLIWGSSISKSKQKSKFEFFSIYFPDEDTAFKVFFLYPYFLKQAEIVFTKLFLIVITFLHSEIWLLVFYILVELLFLLFYCVVFIVNKNMKHKTLAIFFFLRSCLTFISFWVLRQIMNFIYTARKIVNECKKSEISLDELLIKVDSFVSTYFRERFYDYIYKITVLANRYNSFINNYELYMVIVAIEILLGCIILYMWREYILKPKRVLPNERESRIDCKVKSIFYYLLKKYTNLKTNSNSLKAGLYKDICLFTEYLKKLDTTKIIEYLFPHELFFAIAASVAIAGLIKNFYAYMIMHFFCVYTIMYGYIGMCNYLFEEIFKFKDDKKIGIAFYCCKDFSFWNGLMIPKVKLLTVFSVLPILFGCLLITLIYVYYLKFKAVFLLFNIFSMLICIKFVAIQIVKPFYLYYVRNLKYLLMQGDLEDGELVIAFNLIYRPSAIVKSYLLFVIIGFLIISSVFCILKGVEWLYCYIAIYLTLVFAVLISGGKNDNDTKRRKIKNNYTKDS